MIYNLESGSGGASTADRVEYDNTESSLESTNVQGAIDELDGALDTVNEDLTANSLKFKFGYDGDSGKYGYYGADGSLIPFKSGGGEPVQIRASETWDKVNTTLTISGDFSDKHYAIIEMRYASSSGTTTSAVPKGVNSYICAPQNISSTAQGYVASRLILFENDKLTINTPTWSNYGLLRNIWVI